LLLFFALFALWRRRRLHIAIVAATLAWAVGGGWIATPLLDLAQRDFMRTDAPSFGAKTTIVLMGGGTDRTDAGLVPKPDSMQRIAATAALYRACIQVALSCKVIVSGGDPQHHGQAEADNYAPYVLAQGVAPDDLVRENQSLNTYQNARNVAAILAHAHDNHLIIVTSAYHMRRSLLAFNAFGLAPEPLVSDARHNRVTVLPRVRGFENTELALHELVGLARFEVYRWLGLY
jgi:uncharacterized SAM-binding protein YcdF (DUF218 family)